MSEAATTKDGCPTVSVQIDKPYTVRFDLRRLMKIEEASGMTCFDLLQRLMEMAPRPDTLDGKRLTAQALSQMTAEQMRELATGEKPRLTASQDAVRRAGRSVSVPLLVKFVAGCIDLNPDDASEVIPPKKLVMIGLELLVGLGHACAQLGGGDDEGKEAAQASGVGSEPGPASN